MARLLSAPLLVIASILPAPASARNGEAGVAFLAQPRTLPYGEELAFRFDEGRGWTPARIRTQWDEKRPYDYRVTPWGRVRVEATLRRRGTIVARVQMTISARSDHYYIVRADLRPDDPTRFCKGCSKAAVAPIVGEFGPAARRVWLHYGFNRISQPIIF